jgi:hypothetical protein
LACLAACVSVTEHHIAAHGSCAAEERAPNVFGAASLWACMTPHASLMSIAISQPMVAVAVNHDCLY